MPQFKPFENAQLALIRLGKAMAVATLTAALAVPANAQTPGKVAGIWYDSAGEGAIELAPCGNRMCGRIVWLKNQLNDQGKPLYDRHNPNASMQSRPICGLQVLRDLQPLTDGSWGRGIVYDPKKGAENEASIKPLSGGRLQLTGYGLFGLSKSFEWTRAPDDLQKCGASGLQPGSANGAAVPAAKAVTAPAGTKPAALQAGAAGIPAKPGAAAVAKPAAAATALKPAAGQAKSSTTAAPAKPEAQPTTKPATAPGQAKATAARPASPLVKKLDHKPVAGQAAKPTPQKSATATDKKAAPPVKIISKAGTPASTQPAGAANAPTSPKTKPAGKADAATTAKSKAAPDEASEADASAPPALE